MKWGNCGDISTGTKSSGIGTHIQMRCSGVLVSVPSQSGTSTHMQMRCSGVLVPYHTNLYRYQHAIFVGFKRNFNLGARARSSFDSNFEITNVDCI